MGGYTLCAWLENIYKMFRHHSLDQYIISIICIEYNIDKFRQILILIYNLVQSSHKKLYTNKIPKVILHTLLINIESRVDLNARSITPEQKNKRQAQKNKRSPPIIKTLHLFLPFDFEYSIYTLSHTSKFGCIRIHTNRLKTV